MNSHQHIDWEALRKLVLSKPLHTELLTAPVPLTPSKDVEPIVEELKEPYFVQIVVPAKKAPLHERDKS